MVANFVTGIAGICLLFTTLVLVKGGDIEPECDLQLISSCYWEIADRIVIRPFMHVPENSKNYLKDFCRNSCCNDSDSSAVTTDNFRIQQKICHEDRIKSFFRILGPAVPDAKSDELPVQPPCKKYYRSCSNQEKEMFTSMERGYTSIKNVTGASRECDSVTSLRTCLNLDEIRSCRRRLLSVEQGTFEMQAGVQKRNAQDIKLCLLTAANPCRHRPNNASITHLENIADATIQLTFFPVTGGAASLTKAAIVVIGGVLLISLAGAKA
ncbi:uncharacterized protein LOC144106280 isoform X1 [Amblyomma americanum]